MDYETEDVLVNVELEKDYVFIDAQVRLTVAHQGRHPFGQSRVIDAEIEEIACFGDDGEDVKYLGEADKEIVEAAKNKWRNG